MWLNPSPAKMSARPVFLYWFLVLVGYKQELWNKHSSGDMKKMLEVVPKSCPIMCHRAIFMCSPPNIALHKPFEQTLQEQKRVHQRPSKVLGQKWDVVWSAFGFPCHVWPWWNLLLHNGGHIITGILVLRKNPVWPKSIIAKVGARQALSTEKPLMGQSTIVSVTGPCLLC